MIRFIFPIAGLFILFFVIIDFVKNRRQRLLRRLFLYSFAVYLLLVLNVTTGHIFIPPFDMSVLHIQLMPFYFIKDLFYHGFGSWYFWNSLKLSFYHCLMLMSLGVYLSFLFNIKTVRNAFLIIILTSLFIETYQLIFSYFGFITRSFDVDD